MRIFHVLCLMLIFSCTQVYGTSYVIKVSTSQVDFAGTDARVYVNLIGVNGQSTGSIRLPGTSIESFEYGRTDIFHVNAKFVGHLKAIKVYQDGTGFHALWHLAKITVSFSGSPLYTVYFHKWIPSRQWITAYEQNECRAGVALCQHLCIDTSSSYNCACHKGYRLEGRHKCQDINECMSGVHKCEQQSTTCSNTQGSYICHCKNGYQPVQSLYKCQDVNECDNGQHKCDSQTTTCSNTLGSYTCQCKNGYQPDQSLYKCQDENECVSGKHKCEQQSTICNNSLGSYTCQCKDGYEPMQQSIYECQDVNECDNGQHKCDSQTTTCSNTLGSYTCHCKNGYQPDQSLYKCQDENECVSGKHKCEQQSTICSNSLGNYTCQCKDGYEPMQQSIYECQAKQCNASIPLGMQDGQISNQSITASSHHFKYPPWEGRLNAGIAISWYAVAEDTNPWIQVDLGKVTWLKGVATQGKMFTLFVKTYKLAYSSDEVTWFVYRDAKVDKIFKGNTEPYKTVKVELAKPVYTRYVRLYPQTWNDGVALKLELFGCRPE